MAMRHGGGEERSNVSRSAVESGKAARDEAPSAVVGGSFHRAGSAATSTAANVPLKQGADERPLIAYQPETLTQPKE